MFKISSFGTNTCLKTFALLISCVIDNVLSLCHLLIVNKSDVLVMCWSW